MRVALLARAGATGWHLASVIDDCAELVGIVVETGSSARRRKARRTFRQRPIRGAADLAAIAIYSRQAERGLRDVVRAGGFPPTPPKLVVDGVNDPAAIDFIRALAPEIIVVSGTSILKDDVLSLEARYHLNVHGGSLPAYRNVHSDFWAFVNGDATAVGSAIVHLDRGVDTGDIALQATLGEAAAGLTLRELKQRNLLLAGDLLRQTLKIAEHGDLPRVQQPAGGRSYPTPSYGDLRKIRRRRVRDTD
jgi:methionyl-tRNA formyltransferase